MPTIAEQLTQLESDRSDLVDNLETKGITGLSGDETFTELVPEVLNIPSGGGADLSEYFKTSNNGTFASYIKKVPSNITFPTNMANFFDGFSSLTEIPMFTLTTNTSMAYTFRNCSSITTIPNINTFYADSMSGMLYGCSSLISVPQFDMSRVQTVDSLYFGCSSLTTIPTIYLSYSVTSINNMFSGCSSLTAIPQINNTGNVTFFTGCFQNCSAITTAPSLDTSKAIYCNNMFSGCTNLTTVPVYTFSTVLMTNNMFLDCPNLTNESLNNILGMIATATGVSSTNKTLKKLGLSSTQATRCRSLSNWSTASNAGWTTGY